MTTATANPNHVNKSCSDARSAVSSCPLELKNIQLIPLRYGLVERHAPEGLPMPYRLQSRPMGIRLLRDGFLYVIHSRDPKKPVLHEFKVSDGKISQLLWNSTDVSGNTRSSSVGPAKLIYKRSDTLYVAYAEVQWTARKCAQVLKSELERAHFMQCISLSGVDCERGGSHLLTPKQAQQWLAEVAEQPAQLNREEQQIAHELKDYAWENGGRYKKVPFASVSSQVHGGYEKDHVYLLVRDDFGVMRDLAEHQDLVTGWVADWAQDTESEKRYVIGCYIESLYQVTGGRLAARISSDPELNELWQNCNEQERQSILNYVSAKNRAGKTFWQKAQDFTPFETKDTRTARQHMKNTLGEEKYERYEEQIETLDEEQSDLLNGAKMGQQGIDELINRPAMESFMVKARQKLQRWHKRLDLVSADRITMLQYFHRSAWYFDPQSDDQIRAALVNEYECLKDICRNDDATRALSALLENQPGTILPLYPSVSRADQLDFDIKLASIAKTAADGVFLEQDISKSTKDLEALVKTKIRDLYTVPDDIVHLVTLRNGIYAPAIQLQMASALEAAFNQFNAASADAVNHLIHRLPHAVYLSGLQSMVANGLTLTFATAMEVQVAANHLRAYASLEQELTQLKNQRKNVRGLERNGRARKGSHRPLNAKIDATKQAIKTILVQLNGAADPLAGSSSSGKLGANIKGLSDAQRQEIRLMAADGEKGSARGAMTRSLIKSADSLAVLVAVLQMKNMVSAWREFSALEDKTFDDYLTVSHAISGAFSGSFGAAQGISVTIYSAAIKYYGSAHKVVGLATRLGRLTALLGLPAYGAGILASGLSLIQNIQRWGQAATTGNKQALLGATAMAMADAGSLSYSFWAAKNTTPVITAALRAPSSARAAIWASNAASLRSVFMITTRASFLLGIVALSGEYIYNYHSRTELDLWLEEGSWGNRNKNQSLDEEQLRLERISSVPSAALVPVSGASDGRCAELRVSFPLISADSLQSLSAEFTASWLTERLANEWQHYAETMLAQLSLTSASNAPLRLRFPIYPNEANADHGLLVGLRYRPGYPFQIRNGKQEYLFELMGFANHQPQLWGGAPKMITRQLQPVKIGRMRQPPQWRPISLHDLILDNEQA